MRAHTLLMIPRREALIASLIQYRLSLRRLYRNLRRALTTRARPSLNNTKGGGGGILNPGSSIHINGTLSHDNDNDNDDNEDDDNLPRSRPRGPAQLPATLPDSDPLPTSLMYLILFLFAFTVRAWRIDYPGAVVFDEVHFLRFVRAYYYGEYFFDIHPPLGKLILLFVTYLFCGKPTHEFKHIGDKFEDQPYVPLRITSALFGACVSPLTYAIARQLGLSSWASLFASGVQIFEHLAVIESRLVLMDGQLMMFMSLSLLLALKLWGKQPGKRWSLVIGTALAGCAALSVKWTSLTTPALIAIISLLGTPFASTRLRIDEMGLAGGIAFIVYTFFFWIHFRLLPKSGKGDPFMRREFQQTLINNQFYDKTKKRPWFLDNFFYLNAEMYFANKGIKARHRWESKWWQWIINQRGLLFHNDSPQMATPKISATDLERIYLIVNPVVTLITCIAIPVFMALAIVWLVKKWRRRIPAKKSYERRRMHAFVIRGAFLLCGYIFNLLPYVEVARCTFLYHYLPALFYALLLVSNVIDLIPSLRIQRFVSITLLIFVFTGFIIWRPWIYASPLTKRQHAWRRLYGDSWK